MWLPHAPAGMQRVHSAAKEFAEEERQTLELANAQLAEVRRRLSPTLHPNVLPMQRVYKARTHPCAFLVRQHVQWNLYERISTRPFLSEIEKRWITFQLLRALAQCHSVGVVHGDVKSENVLCTSWNWIFLTDFAPFKPVRLPEDDHSDFHFFFDASSGRRRCYVAPERFGGPRSVWSPRRSPGSAERRSDSDRASDFVVETAALELILDPERVGDTEAEAGLALDGGVGIAGAPRRAVDYSGSGSKPAEAEPAGNGVLVPDLLPSMDVFSAGCVIAEIFLEGTPAFSLSELLKYRAGELALEDTQAARIPDARVRKLVMHMLSREPTRRLTAAEYVVDGESGADPLFPPYFREFLEPFGAALNRSGAQTTDARIRRLCGNYGAILRHVAGVTDPVGESFFRHCMSLDQDGVGGYGSVLPAGGSKHVDGDVADAVGAALGGPGEPGFRSRAKRDWEWDWEWLPPVVTSEDASGDRHAPARRRALHAALAEDGRTLSALMGPWRPSALAKPNPPRAAARQSPALRSLRPPSSERRSSMDSLGSGGSESRRPGDRGGSAPAGDDGGLTPSTRVVGDSGVGSSADRGIAGSSRPRSQTASSTPGEVTEALLSDIDSLLADIDALADVSGSSTRHGESADLDGLHDEDAGSADGEPTAVGSGVVAPDQSFPGLTIIVSQLCSFVRHGSLPRTRVTGIVLVARLASLCDDEVRLQRVVPFVVPLLQDSDARVRCAALRATAELLGQVTSFPPSDAAMFPRYILPAIARMPNDPEIAAQLAFADCLPCLAEASRKFLELAQWTQQLAAIQEASERAGDESGADGSTRRGDERHAESSGSRGTGEVVVKGSYDAALQELQDRVGHVVQSWVTLLMASDSVMVKCALVRGMTRLCLFFGREKTESVLLPIIILFMTGKDPDSWQLKVTILREQLVGVAVFVGPKAFERLLMPVLEPLLRDSREPVIAEALNALARLEELGLLHGTQLLGLVERSSHLLLHPGRGVREGAIKLVVAAALRLGSPDAEVLLQPVLRPMLRRPLVLATADGISEAARAASLPVGSQGARPARTADQSGAGLTLTRQKTGPVFDRAAAAPVEDVDPARRVPFDVSRQDGLGGGKSTSRRPRKVSDGDDAPVFPAYSALEDLRSALLSPVSRRALDAAVRRTIAARRRGAAASETSEADEHVSDTPSEDLSDTDEEHWRNTPGFAAGSSLVDDERARALREARERVRTHTKSMRVSRRRARYRHKLEVLTPFIQEQARHLLSDASGADKPPAPPASARQFTAPAPKTDLGQGGVTPGPGSVGPAGVDPHSLDRRRRRREHLHRMKSLGGVDAARTGSVSVTPKVVPQPLPFSEDEMRGVRVRALHVPDQRYSSLHPQPPPEVILRQTPLGDPARMSARRLRTTFLSEPPTAPVVADSDNVRVVTAPLAEELVRVSELAAHREAAAAKAEQEALSSEREAAVSRIAKVHEESDAEFTLGPPLEPHAVASAAATTEASSGIGRAEARAANEAAEAPASDVDGGAGSDRPASSRKARGHSVASASDDGDADDANGRIVRATPETGSSHLARAALAAARSAPSGAKPSPGEPESAAAGRASPAHSAAPQAEPSHVVAVREITQLLLRHGLWDPQLRHASESTRERQRLAAMGMLPFSGNLDEARGGQGRAIGGAGGDATAEQEAAQAIATLTALGVQPEELDAGTPTVSRSARRPTTADSAAKVFAEAVARCARAVAASAQNPSAGGVGLPPGLSAGAALSTGAASRKHRWRSSRVAARLAVLAGGGAGAAASPDATYPGGGYISRTRRMVLRGHQPPEDASMLAVPRSRFRAASEMARQHGSLATRGVALGTRHVGTLKRVLWSLRVPELPFRTGALRAVNDEFVVAQDLRMASAVDEEDMDIRSDPATESTGAQDDGASNLSARAAAMAPHAALARSTRHGSDESLLGELSELGFLEGGLVSGEAAAATGDAVDDDADAGGATDGEGRDRRSSSAGAHASVMGLGRKGSVSESDGHAASPRAIHGRAATDHPRDHRAADDAAGAAGADIPLPSSFGDGTGNRATARTAFTDVQGGGFGEAEDGFQPRSSGEAADHDGDSGAATKSTGDRIEEGPGGAIGVWDWGTRPRGVLVATVAESDRSVNGLAVSQDHLFFAAAYDDSCTRIFSTTGLLEDVAIRSRLTYDGHSGRITSVACLDNSHAVATGSSNGSVHVFKVDSTALRERSGSRRARGPGRADSQSPDLGPSKPAGRGTSTSASAGGGSSRVAVVQRLYYVGEGSIQSIQHYETDINSVLMAATLRWRVHGHDLRARTEAWCTHVPPETGYVTTASLCPGNYAVVVGTERGFICVWDVRFQLLVAVWRHSAQSAVHSIVPYVLPGAPHQLAALVSCGEDEVTAWNLETGECLHVMRALTETTMEHDARRAPRLSRVPTRGEHLAALPAHKRPARPFNALAVALDESEHPTSGPHVSSVLLPMLPVPPMGTTGDSGVGFALGGVRGAGTTDPPVGAGASSAGGGAGDASADPTRRDSSSEDAGTFDAARRGANAEVAAGRGLPVWLLTSSSTGAVRCWDMLRPRASHVVCGLQPGSWRPAFDRHPALPFSVAPVAPEFDGLSMPPAATHVVPPMTLCQDPYTAMARQPRAHDAPALAGKGPVLPAANHVAGVTAMAWLDLPERLLLSGARDGVVKVWR